MRRRYSILFLIALFIIIKIGNIAFFETNKVNYTKVTGVVIEKYTRKSHAYSHRQRRRQRRIKYLTVQYTENGELKTVDNLRANFWETTGDTVQFYITPNGKAVRNTIMDSDDLYIAIICIVGLLAFIKRRSLEKGSTNPQQAVVGTVIDDYDFVPDKADDISADDGLTDICDTNEEPRLRMPVSEKPPFELYTEEEYEKLNK